MNRILVALQCVTELELLATSRAFVFVWVRFLAVFAQIGVSIERETAVGVGTHVDLARAYVTSIKTNNRS